MCDGCLKYGVRSFLRLFNLFEALCGCGIIAYGIYFIVKEPTQFAYMFTAMGGAMLLVALLGWCVVGKKGSDTGSSAGVKLYGILILLLLCVHIALTVSLLFFEHKTIGWIKSHDTPQHAEEVESLMKKHLDVLRYALMVILFVELVSTVFVCCMRGQVLMDSDEEFQAERYQRERLLADNDTTANVQKRHPKTDDQRARMQAKYGDRMRNNKG